MDINPFQKPRVGGNVQTEGLDNYQPFKDKTTSSSSDNRRMYEDLERRQKELDDRAAELDRREKEQSHLLASDSGTNNFPPLPSFCPFRPCFYQDIMVEIPPQYTNVVTRGYHLWIALCGVSFLNLLASLGYMISSVNSSMAGSTLGSAIIVIILCPPAAYLFWFRPLYKAFRTDSSINFFIFFFIMVAQIAVTIIQALGIYWLGSCGWLNGLMMLKDNRVAGGLMLVTAVSFTFLAAFEIILLLKVHQLYRNTDASFEKAKSELGTTATSSMVNAGRYASTMQK